MSMLLWQSYQGRKTSTKLSDQFTSSSKHQSFSLLGRRISLLYHVYQKNLALLQYHIIPETSIYIKTQNVQILKKSLIHRFHHISEGASMYLVNCTSDPDICHEQGVTGFPTLHAFRSFSWMDHSDCFTKHTLQNVKYIRREYHGVIRVGLKFRRTQNSPHDK